MRTRGIALTACVFRACCLHFTFIHIPVFMVFLILQNISIEALIAEKGHFSYLTLGACASEGYSIVGCVCLSGIAEKGHFSYLTLGA